MRFGNGHMWIPVAMWMLTPDAGGCGSNLEPHFWTDVGKEVCWYSALQPVHRKIEGSLFKRDQVVTCSWKNWHWMALFHLETVLWWSWAEKIPHLLLVGVFNHLEKYESQWEGFWVYYYKIKNVWNHQPESTRLRWFSHFFGCQKGEKTGDLPGSWICCRVPCKRR